MPKFLEKKLQAEYPHNPRAVYGTLNELGMMRGNQETAKGRAVDAAHARKASHPHGNLGTYLHPKKTR